MLLRGVSGIRRNTLIINFLEDVKDVSRSFESIIDPIYIESFCLFNSIFNIYFINKV